jgi:hypothetical protein
MAGGNLINYKSSTSVQPADLDTAKLDWNSVISTALVKYMCLDIKNFCLTTALKYFEYMKIPLPLFPGWIVEQYDLTKYALNEYVHLEMKRVVWRLPQMGILANKRLQCKLVPFGYYESASTLSLGCHNKRPSMFTLVVNSFRVKHFNKDDVNHLNSNIKKVFAKK